MARRGSLVVVDSRHSISTTQLNHDLSLMVGEAERGTLRALFVRRSQLIAAQPTVLDGMTLQIKRVWTMRT